MQGLTMEEKDKTTHFRELTLLLAPALNVSESYKRRLSKEG